MKKEVVRSYVGCTVQEKQNLEEEEDNLTKVSWETVILTPSFACFASVTRTSREVKDRRKRIH